MKPERDETEREKLEQHLRVTEYLARRLPWVAVIGVLIGLAVTLLQLLWMKM